MNISAHFPKQLYVAYRGGEKDALSFLTEYGTDHAANKRVATANHWAQGRYSTSADEVRVPAHDILENESLKGFKLVDNVTRWTTSNQVWRVKDPRGFVVEIYSGNLMNILRSSTITEGVIQNECVWGRDSGKNILVPVGSALYKEVLKSNSIRNTKTLKMSDLIHGAQITLKDGTKGTYIGKAYELASVHSKEGLNNLKKPKLVRLFRYGKNNIVARTSQPVIEQVPPEDPIEPTFKTQWLEDDWKIISSERDVKIHEDYVLLEDLKKLSSDEVFIIQQSVSRYFTDAGPFRFHPTTVKKYLTKYDGKRFVHIKWEEKTRSMLDHSHKIIYVNDNPLRVYK